MSFGLSDVTCYLYLLAYLIQGNRSYQSRSGLSGVAFSSNICLWKSDLPPYLYFTVRVPTYAYAFHLARKTDTDRLTDLLAFLFIVYLALKSGSYRSKLPNLLKIMAEDATLYFLVIFTSHFLLILTLVFGSVRTLQRRFVFSFAKTFIYSLRSNYSPQSK